MTLVPDKLALIDLAFTRFPIRTFADLGAVWGVDGGYTFHAMRTHGIETAFMVDSGFTDKVREEKAAFPGLTLVQGNIGTEAVASQLGHVDAVFLFDVLVHQVLPDWDGVLELYAPRTDHFLIYNQQFVAAASSVRLLDLGYEQYMRNVPRNSDPALYAELFEHMYEIHPRWRWDRRVRRDTPDIWQWGVVDHELIATMHALGFGLQHFANHGTAFELDNFENHAFVFARRRPR